MKIQKSKLVAVMISLALLTGCSNSPVLTESPAPTPAPQCFIDWYAATETSWCVDSYIDVAINEQNEKLFVRHNMEDQTNVDAGEAVSWIGRSGKFLWSLVPSVSWKTGPE